MTNEKSVNRNSLREYYDKPPTGYDFTKKQFTDKARGKLRGYWNMQANANEKKEDITREGYTASNTDWLMRYQSAGDRIAGDLKIKGFIRKTKPLKNNDMTNIETTIGKTAYWGEHAFVSNARSDGKPGIVLEVYDNIPGKLRMIDLYETDKDIMTDERIRCYTGNLSGFTPGCTRDFPEYVIDQFINAFK